MYQKENSVGYLEYSDSACREHYGRAANDESNDLTLGLSPCTSHIRGSCPMDSDDDGVSCELRRNSKKKGSPRMSTVPQAVHNF